MWGTSRHPNWAHDSSLESPGCWISNPSGISQFGAHLTLQNFFLPEVLLVGAKGGSKVVFMVFLSSLTIQNLMKCLGNVRGCITNHEKSKNAKISSRKCPKKKVSAWVRDLLNWKTCFWDQKFENDKIFFEFAQIQSGDPPSCIFPSQWSLGQNPEWIRPFPPF